VCIRPKCGNVLSTDVSTNFNETVVGGIVTNTWLYIEGLDRKAEEGNKQDEILVRGHSN